MDLILYRNNSIPAVVDKNLSTVATLPGVQIVNETDDFDVSVRVTLPTSSTKYTEVNYFRWDGAYYYLSSRTLRANGVTVLHGDMDLLMTFKAEIRKLHGLLLRSASHGSSRLTDTVRTISVDSERTVLGFPNQINDTESGGFYALITNQTGYMPA